MKYKILIIDDDQQFINDIVLLLENDYDCLYSNTGKSALKNIKKNVPDIILLDLMLGNDENGLEILEKIKSIDENIPIVMITDYASVDTAVRAIRIGAADYISKTPNMQKLTLIIERAIQTRRFRFYTESLREEVQSGYQRIIGKSQLIEQVKNKIFLSAKNLHNVLITGESGVGKELVARQIHVLSDRNKRPFIPLNCAAIPQNLIESELFGYEAGAFTGANKRKIGKFEIASEGILFFDEISELALDSQVKLLRVLQEGEFERVGGNNLVKTNAKILAATNKNLENQVEKGLFRKDLFYRLDVFPIEVPPLRERKLDIPLLIDHFLDLNCKEMKISKKHISEEAINVFLEYDWPGNIRELRNHVTRAIIMNNSDKITPKDLDSKLSQNRQDSDNIVVPKSWAEMDSLRKKAAESAKRKIEKQYINHILKIFDGNITKAADHEGINRTNFHKMIKRCK